MADGGKRTRRMRDRFTRHEPSVCHERAAIVTEVYGWLAGVLPPILLRAHALAAVLDGMPIFIGPDELVVGNQASLPRAAADTSRGCRASRRTPCSGTRWRDAGWADGPHTPGRRRHLAEPGPQPSRADGRDPIRGSAGPSRGL